jgi:hypothetical protein
MPSALCDSFVNHVRRTDVSQMDQTLKKLLPEFISQILIKKLK